MIQTTILAVVNLQDITKPLKIGIAFLDLLEMLNMELEEMQGCRFAPRSDFTIGKILSHIQTQSS